MTTAVIIILFAAALIAVMGCAIRHEHAKRRIRASFGPEYARVKDEHSRTRAVDRELARRIQIWPAVRAPGEFRCASIALAPPSGRTPTAADADHGSPEPASLRGHRAESVAQAPPAMRRAARA
ncbi:hypothetical protein GCM10009838_88820 [Catenulispora subtropica]|uniref:Secreted protein n=1 Tax=Catenulispora subtropica TaxID=450798 RepID=A0ABP5EZ30_9ACTN